MRTSAISTEVNPRSQMAVGGGKYGSWVYDAHLIVELIINWMLPLKRIVQNGIVAFEVAIELVGTAVYL